MDGQIKVCCALKIIIHISQTIHVRGKILRKFYFQSYQISLNNKEFS